MRLAHPAPIQIIIHVCDTLTSMQTKQFVGLKTWTTDHDKSELQPHDNNDDDYYFYKPQKLKKKTTTLYMDPPFPF